MGLSEYTQIWSSECAVTWLGWMRGTSCERNWKLSDDLPNQEKNQY